MITVGAFEAKTKFSELLDRVERGEEVIVTRHGRRVARIVAEHAELPETQLLLGRLMATRASIAERWARDGQPAAKADEIKSWIEEGRR
ncbi:MAG: type II toxin-antitoxin system Phd/YefM family antitoxin [Bosea sp. (in: a-proteobacteria)]